MMPFASSIDKCHHTRRLGNSCLILLASLFGLIQACCPTYVKNLQATFSQQDLANKNKVEKNLLLEDFYCKESTPYCTQMRKSAELLLKLDLGEDYNFGRYPFEVTVKVEVNAFTDFKASARPDNSDWSQPREFTINISTIAPEQLINVDFTQDQESIKQFKIKAISYTSNADFRNAIRLTAEVRMNWKVTPVHVVDPTLPIVFIEPVKNPGNPVTFKWRTACPEINHYQFQLLRLFNENDKKASETDIETSIDWNRALTLDTDQDSLVLTLTEGTGFYIWRVRPIGSLSDKGAADDINWGLWSKTPPSGSRISLSTNGSLDDFVFFYRQFDEDKNWIYSRTYSEDNKIAEQLTYANGLLQVKQHQKRLQSSDIVLTNQTLYDFSGRPALTSMAAPVNSPAFHYIDRFLEFNGNNYGPEQFDANITYRQAQALTGGPLHQYFSDQHPSPQIPSAEGFPFSRTLYHGDGTGQPKEISSAGATFQIKQNPADSRTTQLFFVRADDDELVRIFGDEAPSKAQVFKTITIDPNKTVSVVFSDVNGDTLATCLSLSKANMDMLDALPERENAQKKTVAEISGPDPFESGIEVPPFYEPTSIELNYSIDPNLVNDPCFSGCSTCDYRVIFTIFKKDDPQDGFPRSDTLIVSPGACESSPKTWTKQLVLQPGSYIFRKRIEPQIHPEPDQPSFLEKRQTDLLNQLDQEIDEATNRVFNYLGKSDLKRLYHYLNVKEKDTVAILQTKCCRFELPVLRCEKTTCPENPDFEQYFINFWGNKKITIGTTTATTEEIAGKTNGKYNFLPAFAPGQFNQLIHNMLNDPALENDPLGPYDCDSLWQCWTGLTQAYEEMALGAESRSKSPNNSQFTLSNTPKRYDLLEQFFTCIGGRRLRGISSIAFGPDFNSPGYLSHAYAYIPCDPSKHKDCAITLDSARVRPSDWCSKTYPRKNLEDFLNCISGETFPTKNGLPDYTKVLERADASKIQEGCEDICEKRKFGFLQSLEQAYLELGYKKVADLLVNTDTVSFTDLQCKAQLLVDQCKEGCKLTVVPSKYVRRNRDSWASVGTSEEIKNFKNSVTSAHLIALPFNGQCPDGYTPTGNTASYSKAIVSHLNKKLKEYLEGLPSPTTGGVFDVEQAFQEAQLPSCVHLEPNCFKQKIPVSKSLTPVFRLGDPDSCQLYLETHRLVLHPGGPPSVVTDLLSVCENLCGCILTCEKVCIKWVTPEIEPIFILRPMECPERNVARIKQVLLQQMALCKADHLAQLNATYKQQCLERNSIRDHFTVSYDQAYYHYTLYYYDRAGNLVRTVAPQGVDTAPKSRMEHPSHTFVSTYDFNSLGQIIKSRNPDGGTVTCYYDKLQQLRFTQNDKQRRIKTYSYNIYDYLGRVVESGESSQDILGFPLRADTLDFPDDATQKTEFTKTVYSIPIDHLKRPQRFLQNRISYAYTHDHAYTYYSYDPHGNVEWMADSVPGLGIKYIDYEYDLISGLVTLVRYNTFVPESSDKFYHRYTYDADKRLIQVETSPDSMIWDRDARYEYYAHGPLKRTVLGEDQVQGVDYTYTLQGWLKGINHPSLDQNKDPGKDGAPGGPNATVGKDAFGMSLSYFAGDFKKSNSAFTALEPGILPPKWNLYDGNIAAWTSQSAPLPSSPALQYEGVTGSVYRYDELNQLKESQFHHFKSGWISNDDYATRYAYDPNGNMDILYRNGYATRNLGMDSLSYHYTPKTNQLNYLSDLVANTNYEVDLDDQKPGNYAYDETGNLTQDAKEGIKNIYWTSFGKVKRIDKSNGDQIDFYYDAAGRRIAKVFTPAGETPKVTYYILDAKGEISAIITKDRSESGEKLIRQELPIYGAERIGIYEPGIFSKAPAEEYSRHLGKRTFELTDHLGDVRGTISDVKLSEFDRNNAYAFNFSPAINSRQNYYPFGMAMPGSNFRDSIYRFGFNRKEKDNEINGIGNTYDFGERSYDPRIAKWNKIDSKQKKYPEYSPYHFGYNNPINVIDIDGAENVVVIGNQGNSPRSDKKGYFFYRYDKYTRHFLEAGLNEALQLRNSQKSESTTLVIYRGNYTKEELSLYESKAQKAGITVIVISSAKEIISYVNAKAVKGNGSLDWLFLGDRGEDKITDFAYVGHGFPDHFSPGYNFVQSEGGDPLDTKKFETAAFDAKSNAFLNSCGSGIGMVMNDFLNRLVGGSVTGFRTTVQWGEKGLGSFRAFHLGYTPLDSRNKRRPVIPEELRIRTERGKRAQ